MSNGGEKPALVVLCSWTNARLAHVQRYSNEYMTLFPNTRIIVLDTHFWDLVCPTFSALKDQTASAVELIHAELSIQSHGTGMPRSGMLLHVLSEGGCFKACKLAKAYWKRYSQKLPVSALVLDSTPGKPRYLRHCKGLVKAITTRPFLQNLCLPAAFAVTGTVWIGYMVFTDFANNPISWSRRTLLDGRYLEYITTRPLLYCYSEQDDIVDSRDIQQHAAQAEAQKLSVTRCKYESDHVSHAKVNTKRYWAEIYCMWSPGAQLERHPCARKESLKRLGPHRIFVPKEPQFR